MRARPRRAARAPPPPRSGRRPRRTPPGRARRPASRRARPRRPRTVSRAAASRVPAAASTTPSSRRCGRRPHPGSGVGRGEPPAQRRQQQRVGDAVDRAEHVGDRHRQPQARLLGRPHRGRHVDPAVVGGGQQQRHHRGAAAPPRPGGPAGPPPAAGRRGRGTRRARAGSPTARASARLATAARGSRLPCATRTSGVLIMCAGRTRSCRTSPSGRPRVLARPWCAGCTASSRPTRSPA